VYEGIFIANGEGSILTRDDISAEGVFADSGTESVGTDLI
jgi:hypothetical protein